MANRAIQRGSVWLTRPTSQQSRPPRKGTRISQGSITVSNPCARSDQDQAKQQHGSTHQGQRVPAQLASLGPTGSPVPSLRQLRQQAHAAIDGIATQQAAQQQ